MRVIVRGAILLAIIVLLAMPPAGALFGVGFMGGPVNIGIPYVMGPGFTFAAPFAQSGLFMQAFNSSTLAHGATGALAIAFPSIGGPGISPTIAQTTSEDIVATKSYFFNDIVAAF
ncbi:MAG: hypothetical protein ACM3PB_00560 [Betaproteobacteria bacterium]